MSLLTVESISAAYGNTAVLHGVSLDVPQGDIVVVLGANGAGKTTLLRSLSGLVNTTGRVTFDGADLLGLRPADIVRRGIAHVPEGRGTFPDLSVEDNIKLGAYTRRDDEIAQDMSRWYDVFPRLAERRLQQAGHLSGGEQQMLAIARALMVRPRLLLLDEPSQGLAPQLVETVFDRLVDINRDFEMTMLVVEQNTEVSLQIASTAYVLEAGQVVMKGPADELRDDEGIRRAYLGY